MIGAGRFKGISANTLAAMPSYWRLVEDAVRMRKSIVIEDTAAIPLRVGTLVQGVLFVQQQGDFFHDPKLLEIFASQAVNMIQNSMTYQELHDTTLQLSTTLDALNQTAGQLSESEKLRDRYEKLTYYDGLTGLPNRRYLEVFFKQLLFRCVRLKNSLACVMIDVDYFKTVNDSYGHTVGDRVLQELGVLLSHKNRGHEFVSRYGGEEFVLLLENISYDNVVKVGERMRSAIEGNLFNAENQPVKITISLGGTILVPTAATTTTEIIEKADSALYEAKNRGRNCCVIPSE